MNRKGIAVVTLDEALISETRDLVRDLRKRMRTTLVRMSAEDLSWRPNGASNCCGQLVLHLCANLHEAVHVGFGGRSGARDIYAEFEGSGPWAPEEIAERIDASLGGLDEWLATAPPEELLEECTLPYGPKREGRRHRKLQVVLSQVMHVAEHLGQIVYIAKSRQGDAFASLSIPRRAR